MESQLGLVNFWTQGDWVTRGVVLLLLVMSLSSWMVIVVKALDVMKFNQFARGAEPFWHSTDFAEGLTRLGPERSNPFRMLAEEGREATAHHRNTKAQLHDTLDISDWVTRSLRNSIDDTTAKLQSGLAILASVGSTAPFVGLFGTVWGIYHALMGIGASGQATIDKVAGRQQDAGTARTQARRLVEPERVEGDAAHIQNREGARRAAESQRQAGAIQ